MTRNDKIGCWGYKIRVHGNVNKLGTVLCSKFINSHEGQQEIKMPLQ